MTTTAAHPTEPTNPLLALSDEQLAELGREFDAIHDEIKADLGDRDARYIRSMIDLHRKMALGSRVVLLAAPFAPAWAAGTAVLSLAKILENMEIGHNVLHGQWDWMNDPVINSKAWDWDTASTAEAWRHSHNYIHHTYTNIRGKDKDLGYEIMRIDPHQKWHPIYLAQPFYNVLLMLLFEWGVAFHDMDLEALRAGEKSKEDLIEDLKGIGGKARAQIVKDYIAWPLLSGLATAGVTLATQRMRRSDSRRARLGRKLRRKRDPGVQQALEAGVKAYKAAVVANATSNVVRNLWAHAIIFCGHFPDQAYSFSKDEVRDETPGGRYVRQLLGAANIEGGPLFHIISGNLGYQVEHHLFPDMPSSRYGEIAPRVRAICEKYELPYNTGPFFQQWGMVNRTIIRLAFPGGKVAPKPGPWTGGTIITEGERQLQEAAEAQAAA